MAEANCIEEVESSANDFGSVVEKLLTFSERRNRERDARQYASEEHFNIFRVLNMTTDEVNCHSRFLHELLSPQGLHQMGAAFLELFFENVLGVSPELWLADATVYKEYAFDDGRIDLLVKVPGKCCVVIEVKVYAADQQRQIARYDKFVREWNKANPGARVTGVYYLTLDGHEATDSSVGEGDVSYRCLSFKENIVPWLSSCVEAAASRPRVVEAIKQYISVIEGLTGGMRMDAELKAVMSEIIKSPINYKAAAQIEEAVREGRIDLLQRIFSQLESYLDAKLPGCNLTSDTERKDIERYYARSGREKPWPRLRFKLRETGDYVLALVVEVEDRLYMGVTFFKRDGSQVGFARIDADRDWLHSLGGATAWREKVDSAPKDDWWIDWCYIDDRSKDPEGNTNLIDFRNCTNGYETLYDAPQFDKRMSEWKKNIDAYLEDVEKWLK